MKHFIIVILLLPLCLQCQRLTRLQKKINYLARKIRYHAKDNKVAFVNLLTKKQSTKAKVIELLLACELGYKRVNINLYKSIKSNSKRISNFKMMQTNTNFVLIGKYRNSKNKHKIHFKFLTRFKSGYRLLFSKRVCIAISIQDASKRIKMNSILNKKIVDWAKNKIGQKVGNGQCWFFIAGALEFNNARHPSLLKYGIIIPLEYVAPGDMVQYNGYLSNNHSAIIVEVKAKGDVMVAHQNAPPNGLRVGLLKQNFVTAKQGTVFFFRPIPK